jgi:hypothetical protein
LNDDRKVLNQGEIGVELLKLDPRSGNVLNNMIPGSDCEGGFMKMEHDPQNHKHLMELRTP